MASFTEFPSIIVIENEIPTEEDWENYLFKKEEKQKGVKEKEELLQKLSLLDDEMTS